MKAKEILKRKQSMAETRNVLKDAELLTYSKHIQYEIEMLWGCKQLLMHGLQNLSRPDLASLMHNAVLESFAIHLRNLVDFLYPNIIKKTDVVADDFFPHGKRPATFPSLPSNLEVARKRAHKQVSHLTTGRLDDGHPGKNWHFHALTKEILDVLVEFARLASPDKLNGSVRDLIAAISKAGP